MENEELRQSWEANADAWTQAVRQRQIESRRLVTDQAVLAAVAAGAQARLAGAGRRALDVGCGEGWLARELAGQGWQATGVDGSAALVDRARALGPGACDYRVLSYEAIAREPALLGGPYDCLVCNFSLLGDDLSGLLRALRAATAPGGRLLIQTLHPQTACGAEPYREGWRLETFAGMGEGFTHPMPWYFRTTADWFGQVTRAGFAVTGLEEPIHPVTGRPLSLLLVAEPV